MLVLYQLSQTQTQKWLNVQQVIAHHVHNEWPDLAPVRPPKSSCSLCVSVDSLVSVCRTGPTDHNTVPTMHNLCTATIAFHLSVTNTCFTDTDILSSAVILKILVSWLWPIPGVGLQSVCHPLSDVNCSGALCNWIFIAIAHIAEHSMPMACHCASLPAVHLSTHVKGLSHHLTASCTAEHSVTVPHCHLYSWALHANGLAHTSLPAVHFSTPCQWPGTLHPTASCTSEHSC